MTDTIFALSSGAPPSAIAIVRLSGPAAHEVLRAVAGELPPARHLAFRTLREPQTGEVLDHGLIAQFPASGSVTGEPLAEFHLHGSRAVVDSLAKLLKRMPGLRAAKPGEFTWRAFHNGRLDLLQVESLSDLLRAETESQRRAALAADGLSGQVERWRQDLLLLSALVEARLDQSDEDDVPPGTAAIDSLRARLFAEISALLDRPGAERLFDGVRVVFAGPPNAGKSTLINALAQRDVAIVSPLAGTTRDAIEAPVKIGGVAFVLTDTAGLRAHTGDEIERIGIERANRRIQDADLVIWMDDATAPPDIAADRIIPIFAQADRRQGDVVPAGSIAVSAMSGQGLQALADILVARAATLLPKEGDLALSRRQRVHLAACRDRLADFAGESDELIGAEHLRACLGVLDELTGRAGTEEMLDALFGTFCIGK